MDFLNQAVAQVRELFLSMSPAARITSALLLGVIVVSLGYLVRSHGGGADEYLFNGEFLDAGEANRIEAAISAANLEGYERVGNRFKVPHGQNARYMGAIASAGALPTNFDTLLQDTLDTSPLLSDATRKQQWKAARERQLSMIVKMMDGVEDAKVMYDIRPARGWEKEQITATVSVMPSGSADFSSHQINMIRKAVAGAIAGLKPDGVTVLDLTGGAHSAGGDGPNIADFEDPYYRTRFAYEERLRGSVQNLLAEIPGVRVQVSAELNPELSKDIREITSADGTAIRQTTSNEEVNNSRVEDKGPVGPRAQGPGRNGADEAVAKSENLVKNDHGDTEFFVPTTEKLLKEAGLTPKHVRIAIAIPSDYVYEVWRQKNQKGPEERPNDTDAGQVETTIAENVQAIAASLLPKELAEYKLSEVTVKFFQSLTPDALEPPSTATAAMLWAGSNLNTLMMGGLAVVSLMMLRSLVKGIPASEPVSAFHAPALLAESAARSSPTLNAKTAMGDSAELGDRPKLKLKKGPSLKDDLLDVVRDDPDGAASILRSWIGNAG